MLDLSAAAALIPFWVRWGGVAAAVLTALLTAGIGDAIAAVGRCAARHRVPAMAAAQTS